MEKVLIAPSRYVQGPGVVAGVGSHLALLGKKVFVLGGKTGLSQVMSAFKKSCKAQKIDVKEEVFGGECSQKEIQRMLKLAQKWGATVIVGVGGGKALDTAKAVAHFSKLPVGIIPTLASTDAPCSALSVVYTEGGEFESYLMLPQNPNLVVVDTEIIAKAPARLLVAGMGDALATRFEAEACGAAFSKNMPGGFSTTAALTLARLSYDILLEYGYSAKLAVEAKVASEAVEKVVEANTLLSGLGFESAGLAAAHAVHNGLTVLEETHGSYHGEKVAFGTLVQLVLENRAPDEIEEVLYFCTSVGLPITLAGIGVTKVTEKGLRRVAEATCAAGETIHNLAFPVSAEMVYAAIVAADALGRDYQNC